MSPDDKRAIAAAAAGYTNALEPCARDWLKKRLSAMMLAFGHERDPERAAAWLSETGRLLWDIPQDILSESIDQAIKRSERGFMPAVGQIRAIADPLLSERRQHAARLAGIEAQMRASATVATIAPAGGGHPTPDEDLIPAGEIAAFNRNMKRFGMGTRCRCDGTTYTLQPGEPDPADGGAGA